jgi:hypothetical protein
VSDKLEEITSRVDAAIEIFDAILEKSKSLLEAKFGKPSSYYDAERQRALSLAHDIFASTVTLEDILALSAEKPRPDVKDATFKPKAHPGKTGK